MDYFRFNKAFLILSFLSILMFSCKNKQDKAVVWEIDSTHEIGGNSVTTWGDPEVIAGESRKMIEFDGENDGLLINYNPIAGLKQFTIEVDFRPYSGFPENKEQRFLHIQDPKNEDRRILLELRLNAQNEWYGDWFIKTENESLTLIDSTLTHPVNQWATIKMVYNEGQLNGYVNGRKELTGNIDYLPIDAEGKTSIGTRMDKRSWFKGVIKEVRFTP